MKKFKFRLERVLDYRNSLKKEKERELAMRNAELHAAEEHLHQIMAWQEAVKVPSKKKMSMAELMLAGDYLRYLQEALISQRLLVLEAANAVEAARDAYIEKAIEAESLETLKKRRFAEYSEEKRRREKKELDTLTVQRYRFKSGGTDEGQNNGEDNG